MQIRKGPFGHFAIEKIRTDASLFEYAAEILQNNNDIYLPMFIDSEELSYDFSGLVSIDDYVDHNNLGSNTNLFLRKKALGGLLLSVISNLNILMMPSCLLLESKFVFTDKTGSILRFCYLPYSSYCQNGLLSDCNEKNWETFLHHDFFSNVVDKETIEAILCSIKENDEKKLTDIAHSILSSPTRSYSTRPFGLLLCGLALAIISLLSLIIKDTGVSLVLAFGSLIDVTWFVLYHRTIKLKQLRIHNNEKTNRRKQMLFDVIDDDNEDDKSIHFAKLQSKKTYDGQMLQFGIYADNVTIGSDRFIADIFIEDDTISNLHAKIKRIDRSYFLEDYSIDNQSYIDNRRINSYTQYEIKNGQSITLGRLEFNFFIGFNSESYQ